MLQGGFKKDSRTWLHKNSSALLKRAAVADDSDPPNRRRGYSDFYNDRDPDPPTKLITDASGRMFKKDSRTWLHKSSVRRLARSVTAGAIRIASVAKTTKKFRNNIHHPVELCTEDVAVGWGREVTRTNSNTEIAKNNHIVSGQLTALGTDVVDGSDERLAPPSYETTLRVGRLPYRPYHGIKICQNYQELSGYTRDLANIQKKMCNQIHQNSSGSESENDEGDDTDGSNCQCHDDEYFNYNGGMRSPRRCPRSLGGSLSSSPELGGGLSGKVCRAAHTNRAIEVTRDGLKQLERLMYKRLEKRSREDLHPMDTQSEGDVMLEKRYVSPANSCVHLEASVNLSDDCLKDSRDQSKRPRSPVKHVTKIPVLRILPP